MKLKLVIFGLVALIVSSVVYVLNQQETHLQRHDLRLEQQPVTNSIPAVPALQTSAPTAADSVVPPQTPALVDTVATAPKLELGEYIDPESTAALDKRSAIVQELGEYIDPDIIPTLTLDNAKLLSLGDSIDPDDVQPMVLVPAQAREIGEPLDVDEYLESLSRPVTTKPMLSLGPDIDPEEQ
jgi:hypothetical protein